jgi:uncharacterized membrane protein YoaK (UPF0700 family)
MTAIVKREVDGPRARLGDLSLTVRWVSQPTVRNALLVALTFSSGAVDAISFLALGKVFTAFMTGNLVFLGFGLAGAEGPDVRRVAVSIAAFAAGVFVAVRIVRASRGSRIWPGRVSIALGVAVLLEAVFLAGWLATSGRPTTDAGDLLVAVVAFAMGIQSGAVLSLNLKGVLTTAATASLMFLVSDVATWADSSAERRRLATVLGALVSGAASTTLLILHARRYAPILPLVVTGLVIATASVALRPPRRAEPL